MAFEAECFLCGKPLEVNEALFCASCATFLTWKYGSVEKYLKLLRSLALLEQEEVKL